MVEVVIPGPERSEGARKPSGYGDCRDMDSGLAPRGAPRNDGGARVFRPGRIIAARLTIGLPRESCGCSASAACGSGRIKVIAALGPSP